MWWRGSRARQEQAPVIAAAQRPRRPGGGLTHAEIIDRTSLARRFAHRLHRRAELSSARDTDARLVFARPSHLPPAIQHRLADLKWWEVFKDEKLQDLERTALAQNYDLRDAVARVEAARANLGITRSDQFPNFGAGADISTVRLSRNGATPLPASFVPSQNRTFGEATLEPAFVRSWISGAGCGAPPRPLARIC